MSCYMQVQGVDLWPLAWPSRLSALPKIRAVHTNAGCALPTVLHLPLMSTGATAGCRLGICPWHMQIYVPLVTSPL